MIKPRRLQKGDTIGVVAPAGPVYDEERIVKGIEFLKEQGFGVKISDNCYLKHGYLAGEDDVRAGDINRFFKDKAVDGIICLRGGYGCARILDKIDYETISKNPKVFIGYSDITALHSAIHKNCNLITFHGPMVASDLYSEPFSGEKLMKCITGFAASETHPIIPLNPGDFHGRIVGGNLSVLCALIGTSYMESFKNKILFIEDVGEEPYSVDRMLQHIKHSGILNRIRGVVLGQFTSCDADDPEKSLTLDYVLKDFFKQFDIPVYYNLPAGHDNKKITIPLGAKARVKNDILSFIEEGVI